MRQGERGGGAILAFSAKILAAWPPVPREAGLLEFLRVPGAARVGTATKGRRVNEEMVLAPDNAVATATPAAWAQRWLAGMERALQQQDSAPLAALFADDCHWRDLLAFTWNITPCAGAAQIAQRLLATQAQTQASGFRLAAGRTAPRQIKRAGVDCIEALFEFETAVGRGYGVLRLLAAQPGKAWVFMTSLHELKGYEERVNERRPSGAAYSREFGGDNWADRRRREQAFEDREPAVLIVGAGQSGLSTAARLRLMGVDALCVEQLPHVGDVWRQRYHSLALHNQVALNHLPYLPFPAHWPKYLPKDMLGNWLEHYAWVMECNVWTQTTFVQGHYDEAAGHWLARVRRADGTERVLRPRHLVFANGIVGSPKMPQAPGLSDFRGVLQHTHGFSDASGWAGRHVLVLGAGTSGHDIAQDLHSHGARVTMIQRGSITVASLPAANMSHSLYYDEGLPVEDSDLIATSATYPVVLQGAKLLAQRQQEMDQPLLQALAARGFKLDAGEDGSGYLMKVRRFHGGYYLNCGCSELIADGRIGLVQYEDIERFVAQGALMKDGSVRPADLIVAATGYQNQLDVVSELLGPEVAGRIGPIWGMDADGELSNMFKPTAQKGLWFIGSSFAQARIFSKVIALQICAREAGIVA